jgi:hypothetical protein
VSVSVCCIVRAYVHVGFSLISWPNTSKTRYQAHPRQPFLQQHQCVLVACVSPSKGHVQESMGTLSFATKTKLHSLQTNADLLDQIDAMRKVCMCLCPVSVCVCLDLFVALCGCLFVPVYAFPCLSMCVFVSQCLSVSLCVSMCLCLSVPISVDTRPD